jgi:hypothetical protein
MTGVQYETARHWGVVRHGSAEFDDRFSVYENSEIGIAQPTLVQVVLTA